MIRCYLKTGIMVSDDDSDSASQLPRNNGDESIGCKVKQWISWSWRYLWGIWFLMIVGLLWTFRGPLRLKENINFGMLFHGLSACYGYNCSSLQFCYVILFVHN